MLLALLGTSCAQPDAADPAAVLQQVLTSHQASLAGIAPRPASAGGEGSVAPAAAVTRPARRTAGGLPTMAGQLVGQTPQAVTDWLGEPRLRREEGTAEIWHYQAPQCHLDLVFYRDEGERDEGEAAALRVAFASARAVGTSRRSETACLRDIASGQLLTPDDPVVEPAPPPGLAAPGPLPLT